MEHTRYLEAARQAYESIKANKLRSILTMLGIIMGVFSIVTIVAIGNAAQAYITAEFERIGAYAIDINTMSTNPDDRLTLEDMEIIKAAVPEIQNIHAYTYQFGEVARDTGEQYYYASIVGVTPQWRNIIPTEIIEGRFINDLDIAQAGNYAVVDNLFAKRAYDRTDILGETVMVRSPAGDNFEVTVVGVLREDDIFAEMMGDMYPVFLYLPVTTVQRLFNASDVDLIQFTVDSEPEALPLIGQRVVKALEFVRGNEDVYFASSSADYMEMYSSILMVVSSVLLVIAIIALIVGGIGIVNILLVSVAERVREIGIRKAMGAQKKDIVMQFMAESVIITVTGGIIGIVLGLIVGGIVSSLINLPPVINFTVVVLALAGAVVLGMIFGVYPAKKAADLDPIEALRHEI